MVTVANLNQPAPPLNDIVVELSVPISFGVSVISAESALPFTLRAEGTRPFALSLAAFTAFGVAASVSDVLLVALLSWTIPFCAVVASCAVYFPLLGFDLSSLSLNANGGIYQSADLSRYSGTVVNRPTFFAFAKGAGVMGEAGPEAILPLRRGADGKLGVVADIGGSGMAMFAPQYNIEINNDGTNGQIGPAALKVVYDLGKKAAADFMQQQARDGGRLSGAYR